jgi:archaemetzincin
VSAIDLIAIGYVEENILLAVNAALWDTFGFEVRRVADMAIQDSAFDNQRRQYNSELILRTLYDTRPAQSLRILGITGGDLFIPMLSFVFGQAQLNGPVAIISFARLYQEFYHLPGNELLTLKRIIKEAIHEVGHTFGLTHCMNTACPMSLSTSITHLDSKGAELCDSCRIVLREHLNSIDIQHIT